MSERIIFGLDGRTAVVGVDEVAKAWGIVDPVALHALGMLLQTGNQPHWVRLGSYAKIGENLCNVARP